jgi:predicted AlkP superfamily pyrophosphatase or phosphodiesterase
VRTPQLLAAFATLLSLAVQPAAPTRNTFLPQIARAYYPGRSGQIVVVPKEGHFITRRDPAVWYMHGSPWTYDTRIPFLLYGPAFITPGTLTQPVTQQDMAPTLATLLGVAMPATASGHSLDTILKPAANRPRVIVLMVLDGMRQDYFDRHAAAMPTLNRIRRQGAWFAGARINYVPSITSAGHATIATGALPSTHGIVANAFFDRIAGRALDVYPQLSPRFLMAPTLADVWNLRTDGRAIIIGQGSVARAAIPLAGHGACQLNGQPVIAVSYSADTGSWESNPECYRAPDYLKDLNTRTYWEESGGQWMGHPIANASEIRGSAVFSKFETDALSLMIAREPFGADDVTDLILVNFKTPDYVGHRYGPESPEMRETLTSLDRDLTRVLAALDAKIGANQYVVAITADHGMPAEPTAPERRQFNDDVIKMIHEKFDPERAALVMQYEPENGQLVINRPRLRELGLSLDTIAKFLQAQPFIFAAYTEDEVARAVSRLR